MVGVSSVGLARLLTFGGFRHVMSLLALKRSAKIDWRHFADDKLPFIGRDKEKVVFLTFSPCRSKSIRR